MKYVVVWLVAIFFSFSLTSSIYAGSVNEIFDDGDLSNWWLGYSHHTPSVSGNWRVDNDTLLNDQAGDAFIALYHLDSIGNQIISTDMKINNPSGYAGITIGYTDNTNWTAVFLYPVAGEVWVLEKINGVDSLSQYPVGSANNDQWYNLRIEVNNHVYSIYLDDVLVGEHIASATNEGKSGVYTGNAGAYFDNFSLQSDDILDPLVNIDQCKKYGWQDYGFKNQGQCIRSLRANYLSERKMQNQVVHRLQRTR